MRIKYGYRQASKENWKRFCEQFPDIKLSYLDWSNIVYTFNYNIRDYCLETGNTVRLPWGFGLLGVSKKKRKKFVILPNGEEKINLAIDWKKSKELGKKVYHMNFHSQGFSFKWRWFAQTARFKGSNIWVFKPSRISSRIINHYVHLENQQSKYKEWDSVLH